MKIAHIIQAVLALTFGSLLTACGVVPPRVTYSTYPSTTATSEDSLVFRHRRSVILITMNAKGEIEPIAAPYELNAAGDSYMPLYSIAGIYDWRSGTQLKISYIDNTRFVDQLDVTTHDNVADTIDKFGKAAASVAGLLAGKVSGTTEVKTAEFKKTMIDPAMLPAGRRNTDWIKDEVNTGYCLRLRNAVSEAGIPVSDYIAARLNATSRDFPVPACSTGFVDVKKCSDGDDKAVSGNVTYATELVIPTALPSSGSVKIYSVCGAKVTPAQSEDRTDALTDLDKLVKAVKDVKAARKKN